MVDPIKHKAKEEAQNKSSASSTSTSAFGQVLPPAKLMERIHAKIADADGDESVLTRKEKKVLEQHRRATEAAEAEALAAKDPLRYFTLSELQSSSGDGHANLKDVVIESFTIHAGKKCLFQNSQLRLIEGSRYGLVGPNGYGKTTVLRFLAERRLPIPEHISCLHVEQEVQASHRSALATVLAADTERAALAAELERVECMLDPVTAQVSCSCGAWQYILFTVAVGRNTKNDEGCFSFCTTAMAHLRIRLTTVMCTYVCRCVDQSLCS